MAECTVAEREIRRKVVLACVVLCMQLGLTVGSGAVYAEMFTALGNLPSGSYGTNAAAISGDGSTVVGYTRIGTETRNQVALRWTAATGMVAIGDTGLSYRSFANAVSYDGSVVVGYKQADSFGMEAYRWNQLSGLVGLGDLDGPNYLSSDARDVSADGTKIVGRAGLGGDKWAQWSEGVASAIGPMGTADAISANGRIIAGVSANGATLWADGRAQDLGMLSGYSKGFVSGIAGNGSAVVGYVDGSAGHQAYRWTTTSGMLGLGFLPDGTAGGNWANGVSYDGSVVVGRAQTTTGTHAFVWDETNGMRKLSDILIANGVDLTGWKLYEATGVSWDGKVIVGHGKNPSGAGASWLVNLRTDEDNVHPVPEPSSFAALIGMGAVGLVGIVRRRRKQAA